MGISKVPPYEELFVDYITVSDRLKEDKLVIPFLAQKYGSTNQTVKRAMIRLNLILEEEERALLDPEWMQYWEYHWNKAREVFFPKKKNETRIISAIEVPKGYIY